MLGTVGRIFALIGQILIDMSRLPEAEMQMGKLENALEAFHLALTQKVARPEGILQVPVVEENLD